MSEFWGFTLVQFYLNEEGNIRYDLINRKHYDPIHRKLLKYQGSMDGVPIDDFPDMLFVGSERDLGIYAELLPVDFASVVSVFPSTRIDIFESQYSAKVL